jgi:hypothetical protein
VTSPARGGRPGNPLSGEAASTAGPLNPHVTATEEKLMTTNRAITNRNAGIIENRPVVTVKTINDRHKKPISQSLP